MKTECLSEDTLRRLDTQVFLIAVVDQRLRVSQALFKVSIKLRECFIHA